MDGEVPRTQKRQAAAKEKANSKNVENSRAPTRKVPEKYALPAQIAGKEVLGRKLSVFKHLDKNPVWIKGTVEAFDEPTIRHKICYELPLPEVQAAAEEWLVLGKSMFMWTDENFVCPFANPTFSLRHTPSRSDAVKVFWTGMGKWYQGKVVDFDSCSGKHKIAFRDGDEKRCLLRQEAIVWLDIPELCSEAAIAATRRQEGEQAAVAAFRDAAPEQQPPEDDAQGSSSSMQHAEPFQHSRAGVAGSKRKSCGSARVMAETDVQSQRRKTGKPEERSKQRRPDGTEHAVEHQSTSEQASEAFTAANGTTDAAANSAGGGAEPRLHCENGRSTDHSKSASSSSCRAGQDPCMSTRTVKHGEQSPIPSDKDQDVSEAGGLLVPISCGELPPVTSPQAGLEEAQRQSEDTASRKRCRLGLPQLASHQQQASGTLSPKQPAGRRLKTVSKSGKKARKSSEEARPAPKRQPSELDGDFDAAGQAVIGARVGVWWEDDSCYYKGKVVAHDWRHKRLRVLYDDAIEEFIYPLRADTRLIWLTPRALTAGATDAVHAAFHQLRAVNAGPLEKVEAAELVECGGEQATPAPMAPAGACAHDGSHLDALIPLRPSSAGGKGKGAEIAHAEAGNTLPHPVDSTTRAQAAPSPAPMHLGVATPSGWGGAPLRKLPSTPGTVPAGALTGLQSMVPPGSLLSTGQKASDVPSAAASLSQRQARVQASKLTSERAVLSPDAGKRLPSRPQPPLGHAAEGWRVSLVFRGDREMFQGRILAYDAKQERHHVLWDDGEDEWIQASMEQLTWHADRPRTSGLSAGLPSGQRVPKGDEMVGWRISVYWKEEKQFYPGTVEEYDSELDHHTISYNDGDELCESLCDQVFKFVLPPTVQTVGAQRVSTRKRAESSEREDLRPRKTRNTLPEAEDSDSEGEWGRCAVADRKPLSRHQSLLQREASTPVLATPRTSDIRRLNSKVGSLLIFEGEETPLDVVTGSSPRNTASAHWPDNSGAGLDPRGQPAIDRRITGLKCAQGYRVSVKRVRVYLPSGRAAASGKGGPPQMSRDAAAHGEAAAALPSQESLRQMLQRVDAAKHSICSGVPAGVFSPLADTLPCTEARAPCAEEDDASLQQPSTAIVTQEPPGSLRPDDLPDAGSAPPSPARTHQEDHVTPPPSPFAPYSDKDVHGSLSDLQLAEDVQAIVPPAKCCRVESSAAVPLFANGSLSLPHTPSARSEGLLGPSRDGSILSAPLLAELAHIKTAFHAAGGAHARAER